VAHLTPSTRLVELRPGGPDDPDAMRAASILAAYFAAGQAQALRRVLWPPAAAAAGLALLLALTTFLHRTTLVMVLLGCAAVLIGTAVFEWRAERRLRTLLGRGEP